MAVNRTLFSSRFPALPTWEQLLAGLYAVPEGVVNREQLRLDLLRLTTDQTIDLHLLLAKLTVLMPRVANIELVAFVTANDSRYQLIASNFSLKRTEAMMSHRTVRQILQTRKFARVRLRPALHFPFEPRVLTYLTASFLGESPTGELFLLTVSANAPSLADLKIIQVASEILRLRGQNLVLKSQVVSEANKLSSLTSHLGEGLMNINCAGEITLWNQALARLTGYPVKEVLGKPYRQFLRRVDHPGWLDELIAECGKQPAKELFGADFELLTRKDVKKWVSVSGSFLKDRHQEVEQTIMIVRDISHFKELEMRKNEFISIATHELRTPITAVMGYLSLLSRERKNLTPKQDLYLMRATSAISRLTRLAEDLLRVVQIEENRLAINRQSISLYRLAEKIIRDLTPKAEQKGLTVRLLKPNFSTQVIADPERMEQVYANLVDNAIKYTAAGWIEMSFVRGIDRRGKQPWVATLVKDTGIGISTQNIRGVFEKFQRSHRPEQVRELGAGLGLFIARSFVTRQGGSITVKSRPGKGTVFSVVFPAVSRQSVNRPVAVSNRSRKEK